MTTLLSPSRRRGRAARVRLSAYVVAAGFSVCGVALPSGAPVLCAAAVSYGAAAAFASGAASAAGPGAGPAAAPRKTPPDLLELPAPRSERAAASVQLAVARAGDRMVSVGEGGSVLLSDDDGATWRQAANVPVAVALTDVAFIDARRGWAVGHSGALLRSDDGGENWKLQADGRRVAQWVAEEAADMAQKAASDDEKTKAGRAARIAASLAADGPDKPLLTVFFVDALRGYAAGAYGLALETRDGGETWRSIMGRLPNPAGNHLYRIVASPRGPTIVGEQGLLIRSTDGGESFEAVESPYEGTFFTALTLKDGGLLAAGLKGNVWRGDAELEKWRRIPLPQPVTATAAARLADGSVALTDEVGRLLVSRDDGESFAPAGVETGAAASGVAQAAGGAIVVSTARGPRRIDLKKSSGEKTPHVAPDAAPNAAEIR